MEKIKTVKFSDGTVGEYWATGRWNNGQPSVLFFLKGNECPTWLCLNLLQYAYTHGSSIYREACENFPKGYSQDY